jgi:hypothetical protein
MTRTQLISACIDLFGYSERDFDDMSYDKIWDYLTKSQRQRVAEYSA